MKTISEQIKQKEREGNFDEFWIAEFLRELAEVVESQAAEIDQLKKQQSVIEADLTNGLPVYMATSPDDPLVAKRAEESS